VRRLFAQRTQGTRRAVVEVVSGAGFSCLQGVFAEREARWVAKHNETRAPITRPDEAGSKRSERLPARRRNAAHGEARFGYLLLR
jgi:hypothetical protein